MTLSTFSVRRTIVCQCIEQCTYISLPLEPMLWISFGQNLRMKIKNIGFRDLFRAIKPMHLVQNYQIHICLMSDLEENLSESQVQKFVRKLFGRFGVFVISLAEGVIYIPMYICTYLHMYIPTYVCTYLHMYIPTYVHTNICTNVLGRLTNSKITAVWWRGTPVIVIARNHISVGSKPARAFSGISQCS
jgi:hypothetical protein